MLTTSYKARTLPAGDATSLALPVGSPWDIITIGRDIPPSAELMGRLFAGSIAGIRVPDFFEAKACAEVVDRLKALGLSRYEGMIEALATLWPNHWPARYVHGDWEAYFNEAPSAAEEQRWVFEPMGDPRALVNNYLAQALGPIEALRCPWTDRAFHTVIVRAGTAKKHLDNTSFDLPAPLAERAVSNVAWNGYLQAPGGGELVMYRRLGTEPGLTKADAAARGLTWFGNYDVPEEWVEGVEQVVIPVAVGDLVIVPNRWIHSVLPVAEGFNPEDRIAVSAHIVQMLHGYRDFN